jgi:hypothetical protein
MPARWRGRLGGLAILAVLAALIVPLALTAAAPAAPALVVTGPDGSVLAERVLHDGGFSLRYRNSLYRSLAEERYAVDSDGRLRLVELSADELAVLEEYYAIDRPAERQPDDAARAWRAEPAREVVIESLLVAATDLGQRVLLVDGAPPLELWRLVEDGDPSVRLEVKVP